MREMLCTSDNIPSLPGDAPEGYPCPPHHALTLNDSVYYELTGIRRGHACKMFASVLPGRCIEGG